MGQKRFVVWFDPTQVDPAKMLEAVTGLGFKPSQDGPVRALIDGPAATVEAGPGAATLAPGAAGKVEVTLTPKTGVKLKAAKVALQGDAVIVPAKPEEAVQGEVGLPKKVLVAVTVAKDAKPGDRTVTVRVTFTAQEGEPPTTVELRVAIPVR